MIAASRTLTGGARFRTTSSIGGLRFEQRYQLDCHSYPPSLRRMGLASFAGPAMHPARPQVKDDRSTEPADGWRQVPDYLIHPRSPARGATSTGLRHL